MDRNNVEVKLSNGVLTIKGKRDKRPRKRRRIIMSPSAATARSRVDADKIEAAFSKGVLTVTLPKTAEAQKSAKTIAVKAA